MPKISVIVPVYKVEQYLDRCVESILAQTFTDFELILVDDGSPDKCPEMCDGWLKKDNRITVIHKLNGGLSDARNAGIDWTFANSDSEWLTFIDSDDWIHPQMLEILLDMAKTYNVKLSMCNVAKISKYSGEFVSIEDSDSSVHLISEEQCARLFFGSAPGGYACCKLFDKTLFDNVRFPYGRLYEDVPVTSRMFYKVGKFAESSQQLYFYFINEEGITNGKFSLRQLDVLWYKSDLTDFYKSIGYNHMVSVVVGSYLQSAARCYRALIDELKDNKTAKLVKKQTKQYRSENKDYINLSKKQKQYIFSMMHPNLVEYRWKICALGSKIKGIFKK